MTTSSTDHSLSFRNTVTSASLPSEADMARMADLGVRFDGRFYQYKDYHYDRLVDALSYAMQDRDSHAYQAVIDDAPIWTSPAEPTEEERRVMKELDVAFDGRYYHYSDYRYDRLADAVNYARLKRLKT